MYKALDIAKYVINKSNEIGQPVSNLQLQKILYYIQGEFLSKLDREAFDDDIVAWTHGPVIPNVYYNFNIYVSSRIKKVYEDLLPEFTEEEQLIVDKTIEKKSKISAWDLVDATHEEEPWISSYVEGKNIIISKEKIQQYFKSI